MRTFTFFLLTTFVSILGLAQTGNFTTKLKFNNEDRTIAWYVPGDYDDSKSYRLIIGLHGLGDNASNYRNAIINSRKWPSIFPNTIFAFPDGGEDQNSDFYAPQGDEVFISKTMESAIATYNIDEEHIVLQGFSLGGSSALQFGLNHTDKFEALLLNTPAIQGYAMATNRLGAGYSYANAKDIPIFISHGADDAIYTPSINEAVRRIKMNNGKVKYILMANVGHSLPNHTIMNQVQPFFDQPSENAYDVDAFDIQLPTRICSDQATPVVLVQNRGSENITSIDFIPMLDGNKLPEVNWSGSIAPFETASIPVHVSGSHGTHEIGVQVGNLNTTNTDENAENNTISHTVYMNVGNGETPNFVEDFEGDSENWLLEESKTIFSWYSDDEVRKSGDYSLGNFNTLFIFNTLGNVEHFESPVLDLSKITKPGLTFDLAYNYHRYTPPYFTDTVNLTDTLEIQISTNCGADYETIFRQWGDALATADQPIINPLQVSDCFFTPTEHQWKNIGINLEKYKDAKNAVIRFNYISGLGGSINIDNIEFGSDLNAPRPNVNPLNIYPNPAQDFIQIDLGDFAIKHVQIIDALGRVKEQKIPTIGPTKLTISTQEFTPGLYTVQVVDQTLKTYAKKIVVQP